MHNEISLVMDGDIVFAGSYEQFERKLFFMGNQELLDFFKTVFLGFHDYKPSSEDEKWDIIEISSCITNEFERRMYRDTMSSCIELLNLVRKYMKEDYIAKFNPDNFYTRNLIRLQTKLLRAMENKGMTEKEIKRDYL